jgi:hypothetical protein
MNAVTQYVPTFQILVLHFIKGGALMYVKNLCCVFLDIARIKSVKCIYFKE